MPSRLLLRAGVLVVLTCLGALPHVGVAQVRIPSEALRQTDLTQVLDSGREMERGRKWGDVIAHYEEALKANPGQRELQDRLTLAKTHFDVARRYVDTGFLRMVTGLTEREAIDQYAEVLLKVQSHYVDTPNWNDVLKHGARFLEIALSEPEFVKRNLANVPAERIEQFRTYFRQTLDARLARTRQEVRDLVWYTSRAAHQHVGLSYQATVFEFTCGAINSLDDYSTFLTADQLDDTFSQIEGNFVGLGIELKSDNQSLLIVNVITGSPAQQAGIRRGERIVEVDGHSTRDVTTDSAADLLKGLDGSTASLVMQGVDGTTRSVRVRRQRVEVPSVENTAIIDRDLAAGYVKITSFQKTTTRDFDAALWELYRQGMKNLIVDVRGNPGGLLTAAVEIADRFVTTGPIVSTRGRSPNEDADYRAHEAGTWRVPLVVLIDRDSASASEIFAGAIRDHRRGTVVGERSFGKGSVQGIFPLDSTRGGVRLTTAKFYSPNGHPISQRGIHPEIVVAPPAKETQTVLKPTDDGKSVATDPVLDAGLMFLRNQTARR